MSTFLSISASPQQISSTHSVLTHVNRRILGAGHTVGTLQVRDLPAHALLAADVHDPEIAAAVSAVRTADAIVVATPVYQAAYSGLLKVFLDLLPQFAFRGKAVLPIVTGGSPAHVLAVDYALRPVLANLGAAHIGQGWFVPSSHIRVFADGGVVIEPASLAPLAQVTDEFLTTVQRLNGWAVVPGRVDARTGSAGVGHRWEPGSAGRAGGGGRSPADAPVDRSGGGVRHPVRPAVCQHPADRGSSHRFRRAERCLPDPAGERGNRCGWRPAPLRRGDRRGETGLDVLSSSAPWAGAAGDGRTRTDRRRVGLPTSPSDHRPSATRSPQSVPGRRLHAALRPGRRPGDDRPAGLRQGTAAGRRVCRLGAADLGGHRGRPSPAGLGRPPPGPARWRAPATAPRIPDWSGRTDSPLPPVRWTNGGICTADWSTARPDEHPGLRRRRPTHRGAARAVGGQRR